MPGKASGRVEMEWGQVFWILPESEWKFLSRKHTEVGLKNWCSCDPEYFFLLNFFAYPVEISVHVNLFFPLRCKEIFWVSIYGKNMMIFVITDPAFWYSGERAFLNCCFLLNTISQLSEEIDRCQGREWGNYKHSSLSLWNPEADSPYILWLLKV